MSALPNRAASLLAGLCVLVGCGGDENESRGLPTAPGFSTPSIRGVYSGSAFWSFEALRLADGTTVTWSCGGRVTIIRQSGADILGTFSMSPSDGQLCETATGNLTGGILRRDARILFGTDVPGQAPDEFFGLPGCVVVSQDEMWSGRANGERLVASRGMTVDCPGDGRMEIIGRADGSRSVGSGS